MSNELICPECGGVIGGDGSDPGRVCTCLTREAAAKSDVSPASAEAGKSTEESGSSGDTFVEMSAAPAKTCCQCGKDLAGKKRYHDSRGYWCEECHKADKAANVPKGTKCAGCGRIVAEAGLYEFEGERICSACRTERQREAREKRRFSPVKTSAHHERDKRRLLWLLAIVAVLVLIIILRQLKLIGT